MSEVKTYAVNCNDAWLNTDGDDVSGSYVKYADYKALATRLDIAEHACAALAAENELARKAVQAFCDVVGDNTEVIAEVVGRDGVLVILKAMKATGNMSATDAFLAEVRAQGVEILYASRAAQWDDELLSELNEFSTQLREGGAA